MNGGNVLPYIDVPFQHASPQCPEGDAPAGGSGKDA